MYDVIIVGASVAGASTAWHLARLGHSVQLIDRAAFPRRKPCGEGLLPAGVAALERMGVLEQLRPQSRILSSISLNGYGATARADLEPDAWSLGVEREVLDAALLAKAEASGVDVCLGVTAMDLLPAEGGLGFAGVRTNKGDLPAKVIVAADGIGSRMRRAAGLHLKTSGRRYGVSAHLEVAGALDAEIQIHFAPHHEIYITPVGDCVANVAVLLDATGARALSGSLEARYDAIIRGGPSILEAARRIDEPMAAGPFPSWASKAWQSNLVLAGDAAGFFDGVTGEGMSIALVGAEACASAVDAFLDDGDERHFAAYERFLKQARRPSMMLGRLSLALASTPSLGRFALSNLGKHAEVLAKLVAISQGRAALRSLGPRDVLALLTGL